MTFPPPLFPSCPFISVAAWSGCVEVRTIRLTPLGLCGFKAMGGIMAISTLEGLLEYLRPAQFYLQSSFGLDANTASDVVQDVLLRLFRTGPERLDHPKRYLFRACRWRALQILRSPKSSR